MSVWHRVHGRETKRKQRRKEGAAQPLCHACQACHNHTKGHTVDSQYPWLGSYDPPQTKDELLGLIVDDDTPAGETIVITSEDDFTIIDEIKGQEQRRK